MSSIKVVRSWKTEDKEGNSLICFETEAGDGVCIRPKVRAGRRTAYTETGRRVKETASGGEVTTGYETQRREPIRKETRKPIPRDERTVIERLLGEEGMRRYGRKRYEKPERKKP